MTINNLKATYIIYVIIFIVTISILWKFALYQHVNNIHKSINIYSGDGNIEYVNAPPVMFASFYDGIRIVFPEIIKSPTEVKLSLHKLPAGRLYQLFFRVPNEAGYLSNFPGNIKVEVYKNNNIILAVDSSKTVLRNSYTMYNDFYFDSNISSKLFRDKDDSSELSMKIIYSGVKKIQPILLSGGEL